jgi:putative tryptophan/tyrosine transport system substrate-binding protein
MMDRRTFIGGVACGILVGPLAVEAQQPRKMPVVGVLLATALTTGMNVQTIAALRNGLRDLGHVEGQDIVLELRSAGGKPEALGGLAEELVQLNAAVICAFGPAAVRAASAATRTIPIVALDLETDPVQAGWAQSLAHPGRNITGLFLNLSTLTGKWLELLRAAIPAIHRIALLWDSTTGVGQLTAMKVAAQSVGIDLEILEIRSTDDVNAALRAVVSGGSKAMAMLSSPIVRNSSKQIAEFTAKNRLPAISRFRPFADFGGLMFYGPDLQDFFGRCAIYIDKILKGAKPGDLPIEQPIKFEFVINMKTAKALGLSIPQSLLLRADEVIH